MTIFRAESLLLLRILFPLFVAAQTEQAIGESTAAGAAQDHQRAQKSERSADVGMAADQNACQPDSQPEHNAHVTIDLSKIENHGQGDLSSVY